VCECVRIKSSLAFAAAHACRIFVSRIPVSLLRHSKFISLRGSRGQPREGSNPLFRTNLCSRLHSDASFGWQANLHRLVTIARSAKVDWQAMRRLSTAKVDLPSIPRTLALQLPSAS
jgi:hypothetical protein